MTTLKQIWSKKAKELMRNAMYLDEIEELVCEWLEQKIITIPYGQAKYQSPYMTTVRYAQNRIIKELLEDLKKKEKQKVE